MALRGNPRVSILINLHVPSQYNRLRTGIELIVRIFTLLTISFQQTISTEAGEFR